MRLGKQLKSSEKSEMNLNTSIGEWLPWLGRVRFLVITFLLVVVVAIHQLTPIPFAGDADGAADRRVVRPRGD